VDIIKNKTDRERFLADLTVQAFIKEQSELDAFLYDLVCVQRRDLLSKRVPANTEWQTQQSQDIGLPVSAR
jgi:hypothetical protein